MTYIPVAELVTVTVDDWHFCVLSLVIYTRGEMERLRIKRLMSREAAMVI